MLVAEDLGFLFRVVVTVFLVFFGPVLGLVVRYKWRRAVARREEIHRLVALASEETAIAELEATASYGYSYGHFEGYGNGYGAVPEVHDQLSAVESAPAMAAVEAHVPVGNPQKLLYPCAVCSDLTKSRCKQCKAVHYCSGKCQIIHWRQGHKDECRPYSLNDEEIGLGLSSHPRVSEQEMEAEHGNEVSFEGHCSSQSDEKSFVDPKTSDPSVSSIHDEADSVEVDQVLDDKERHPNLEVLESSSNDLSASTGMSQLRNYASHDVDGPDQHLPNNGNLQKIQNKFQPRASVSKQPNLVHSVDTIHLPGQISHIKSSSDYASSSIPPVSSGLPVNGSSKSSSFEPSTLSSGFWEGKLISKKSRDAHAPDGLAPYSSGTAESSISSSRSSVLELKNGGISHVDTPNARHRAIDGSEPILLVTRKPADEIRHLIQGRNVDVVPMKSTIVTPKAPKSAGVSISIERPISNHGVLAPQSLGATGKSTSEAISKESGMPFRSSQKLNIESNTRMRSSDKSELRKVESISSKAPEASLSSPSERPAFRSMTAVKSGNTQEAAACSLERRSHQQNAKSILKTSMLKVVDQLNFSTFTRQNTSGTGGEITAGYKGLFPYDVFLNLYHYNFELYPCGLVNCGNSCYANVVLQCLAFTPPLTAYFLQGLHSRSCQKRSWCFLCEFERLVLKAREGISPLSPVQIIKHLQNIGSHLSNGREEDAHEFLRYAIDTMQSICLREAGIKGSGSLGEETTLIGLTFGGYLRSKIECMRCGGKSERHERMMDLTVEIDGDIGTLEEALRQFTHAETLDGDNKYQCGRCKSYEKARKKLKVLEAPNVLTIVLKRFQSSNFGKLNKAIKFPEILDLAPYTCGTSDKSSVYRLYGVVVHLDVMSAAFSGHYVCYVKNNQNKWFKADDSMVKPVELERVLTKGAYMLLYTRCAPRAPRSIRKSLAPRDPRKAKNRGSVSTGSRGVCTCDTSNGQACHECFNSNHASSRPTQTTLEDDSSSDNSSFFSEGGSCSTDSNRDSTSTEDYYFDPIFGEMGARWNSQWRNSSDSDTSSSSSSPSPLFSRHSPLADSDRYASGYPGTSGSSIDNAEQGFGAGGFWARSASSYNPEDLESKADIHFSYTDSSKQQHRKSVSSSSNSREIETNRLGRSNPFEKVKSGVFFRR